MMSAQCIQPVPSVALLLRRLHGHQPQQTGSVEALLGVNFLNNSSSCWEVMLDPWPVSLLLSNPINKLFKKSRTTWV